MLKQQPTRCDPPRHAPQQPQRPQQAHYCHISHCSINSNHPPIQRPLQHPQHPCTASHGVHDAHLDPCETTTSAAAVGQVDLECHRTAEHMPPTSIHTTPAGSPLTTPCRDALFRRREENTGAVRGVMCDGESKGQTIVNGRSMKTPGEESEVAEMAETVDIMI